MNKQLHCSHSSIISPESLSHSSSRTREVLVKNRPIDVPAGKIRLQSRVCAKSQDLALAHDRVIIEPQQEGPGGVDRAPPAWHS